MMRSQSSGQIISWLIVGLCCLSAAGASLWHLAPCEFRAISKAEYIAELSIPYQEVRTLLVRNDATKAIIEQDGVSLLDEKVLNLKLDFSKNKRPLMNAILGKSRSNITAKKRLVVAINNEDVNAKNLILIQDSKVTSQGMIVKTISEGPAGDLTSYSATLQAVPNDNATSIRLAVEISICKSLSSVLHPVVQSRLDEAARVSVQQQYVALEEYFSLCHAK